MARVPVGPAHNIAGIIHTQIERETTEHDPQKAFLAQVNGPGFNDTLPLNNKSSKEWKIPVPGPIGSATLRAEVDDFTLLPAGSSPTTATAISCKVVFKLKEFFTVTIGSVDVTASLK